jgi:uncharacterized membrane protein
VRTRALNWLEAVRSSFWFIPSLLVLAAFITAVAMVALDRHWSPDPGAITRYIYYSGGEEGARSILGTIAGAMMTIAGVVFSLTMVTLTLASSQFGPRLVRNFMRSRGTQLVLGTFIATFIYCLLVLLTVQRLDDGIFIPGAAVSLAVLIAVINAAMLVWFIHHLASVIQADLIVADVGKELEASLTALFPENLGARVSDQPIQLPATAGPVLQNQKSGYLLAIQGKTLLTLACKHDWLLLLHVRSGDFLYPGMPLLEVHGTDELDKPDRQSLLDCFLVGDQRSAEQDIEFSARQLVEVGLRALSPSTNDPFTAMACLDRLGAALCLLGPCPPPANCLADEQGTARLLVSRPQNFEGVFHACFDQLRQAAIDHAAVGIRLLEVLGQLAHCVRDPERLALIRQTAEAVASQCAQRLPDEMDRSVVHDRLAGVISAVAGAGHDRRP